MTRPRPLVAGVLGVSLVAGVGLSVGGPGDASASAIRDMSVLATVTVGVDPWGLALTSDDQTLYVANTTSNSVSVLDTQSFTADDSITVGSQPYAVVLTSDDDTLFVTNYGGNSVSVASTSARAVSSLITGFVQPLAAVLSGTNLFVSGYLGRAYKVNPSTQLIDDSVDTGSLIWSIAASPAGATVYQVASAASPRKLVGVSTASPMTVTSNANVVGTPRYAAISADGSTAFVTIQAVDTLSGPSGLGRVNLSTNTLDDTVAYTPPNFGAGGLAISPDGSTIFAAHANIGGGPSILYRIDAATLTVDDSVTLGVGAFGDVVLSSTGDRAYVANRSSGTVSVIDTGLVDPTPPPPPTPAPAVPASAPLGVQAVAGDASARVSWTPPESTGSFAVSHYLATSTPCAHTCLVTAPAVECEITSLTNGTAYTFSVKALTGAGWSVTSEPSNAVVPRASAGPSIVITGSRDGRRIEVSGSTTGFGMGGVLNPWVRLAGQSAYSEGSSQVLVSMDGTFAWSRTTGKRASVYMQTPDGSVRSNTVTIRAR